MNITLAFTTQKDLEANPVLFTMLGFLPTGRPYPAPSRTFHTVANLLQALEPAQINPESLRQLEKSLERGRDFALDVSADQANSLGMFPSQGS
jgi:hypothetical protein